MATIYLATKNRHKVLEIQQLMGPSWQVLPCDALDPSISWDETATHFRGNARIKAQALLPYTKDAILADDSGLEVDVLNGAPGVYSARYAGTKASDLDNLQKLLKVLQGVPEDQRRARFVCTLCYIDSSRNEHFFQGTCEGSILEQAEGTKGFGYDPIFRPSGFAKTFAELSEQEKNALSHRGQAMQQFLNHLGRSFSST